MTPLDRAVAGDDTGEEGRGKKRWVVFVWSPSGSRVFTKLVVMCLVGRYFHKRV